MLNKKYANMGIRELQYRVITKYQEVLKSSKLIYVVGKHHYYGENYGLFNEETVRDFSRDDLEILLSNKYSALRYLETDYMIVLHDGHAKLVCNHFDDYENTAVWTGKTKVRETTMTEILYGHGSWTWNTGYSYTLEEYNSLVKEKVDEIITKVNSLLEKDYSSEIKSYYNSLVEGGHPQFHKYVINGEKYVILLSNSSEDWYDKSGCITRKFLDRFPIPTIIINKKRKGVLTPVEETNLSLNQIADDKDKYNQYIAKMNRCILSVLDSNELQIKGTLGEYFSIKLWGYDIRFRMYEDIVYNFDKQEATVTYRIDSRDSVGWFSFRRNITKIVGYICLDNITDGNEDNCGARKSLHDFFKRNEENDYIFMTELIIYLINKITDAPSEFHFAKCGMKEKESIKRLFL